GLHRHPAGRRLPAVLGRHSDHSLARLHGSNLAGAVDCGDIRLVRAPRHLPVVRVVGLHRGRKRLRLAFRQGQLGLVQSDLRHVYRLGLHRHSAGAGLALRRRGDGRGAGSEAMDGAGLVHNGDAPVGRRPRHGPVGRGFGRDTGGQHRRSALYDLYPGRGDGHG
ncbi:MAG: hypothetical protein UDN37_10040, partial [Bacteroidales bacterium]|nr:hypothetical protein [Bacteroidales bacterium]